MKKIFLSLIITMFVYISSNPYLANAQNVPEDPMVNDAYKSYRNKDYAKAAEWFEKAHENGKQIPMLMLADIYNYNLKNYLSAARWYTEVVKKGNKGLVAHKLAEIFYKTGKISDAEDWHKTAAEYGNVQSMYSIAVIKNNKQEENINREEVFNLFLNAAKSGHTEAMYQTGVFYANGNGTKKSPVNARKWYKLAADKGHAQSSLNMGDIYFYGYGVRKCTAQAFVWYKKAEEKGIEGLTERIGTIRQRLPSGILNKVKRFPSDAAYHEQEGKIPLDRNITEHINLTCENVKSKLSKNYGIDTDDVLINEATSGKARKSCDVEEGSFEPSDNTDYVYGYYRTAVFDNAEKGESQQKIAYAYKVDLNSMIIYPYGKNADESCKALSVTAYSKAVKTKKWQRDCFFAIDLSGF